MFWSISFFLAHFVILLYISAVLLTYWEKFDLEIVVELLLDVHHINALRKKLCHNSGSFVII